MKNVISKFLKLILPDKIYENRRNNILFISYSNFELYLRTFKLRVTNKKFIFLPSRHIGAIYLLDKLSKILNKKKIFFFLWDASLLGAVRKQNAIAGSASDIDIGIIFHKKKHLAQLLSLKKEFKLKFHHNYSSLQLFHSLGLVDISLFKQKGTKLKITLDIPLKKRKMNKIKIKKYSYKLRDFSPFVKKNIYSKKFLVPKNFNYLLGRIYGLNWKIPDKKEQVYFT